jgi:hypothetical protein
MSDPQASTWRRAFNNPLEAGLRSLSVLFESFPQSMDLDRLVQFDYLVVHSADVPDGPASLHPPAPLRSGELLVRRGLVEQGLRLFVSRGLIEASYSSGGIEYRAGEPAASYLQSLDAPYSLRLLTLSKWAVQTFEIYTSEQLQTFVRDNLDRWGAEFESQNMIREIPEGQ